MTTEKQEIIEETCDYCTARFTVNGEVREQTIALNGNTYNDLLADFVENGNGFDGWEDGNGNAVCWENAAPAE